MGVKELDKLFRSKLKSEATPQKVDSWDKLESMLEEKQAGDNKITYWRVAAVLVLLMVSAYSLMQLGNSPAIIDKNKVVDLPQENNNVSDQMIAQIAPVQIGENQSEKVLPSPSPKEVMTTIVIPKKEAEPVTETSEYQEEKLVTPPETIEIMTDQATEEMIASLEDTQTEEVAVQSNIKKRKKITITYKRGSSKQPLLAENKSDTTRGSKIKGFIALTKELNAGDLWADIRDAKDNLIHQASSSTKNNVKNLNK